MKLKIPKIKKPNLKSILLYYSIFFSTILIIGGFYTSRSRKEIISNLLFLPIVIFLWIILVQKRRETKRLKIQNLKLKKIKSRKCVKAIKTKISKITKRLKIQNLKLKKIKISKTTKLLVVVILLLGIIIGALSMYIQEAKAIVFGSLLVIRNFLGLTDTPSSYSGEAGKVVQVKSDETGLEFVTASTTDSTLVEAVLTNKTGTTTFPGAVFRLDLDNDSSFDLASNSFENAQVAVATNTIANSSSGSLVVGGVTDVYIGQASTATTSRGDFLYLGSWGGQASSTPYGNDGAFGEALEELVGPGLVSTLIYPRERIRKWGWADEPGWHEHIMLPMITLNNLTRNPNNPILGAGAGGTYNDTGSPHPNVLYHNGYFYMVHSGWGGTQFEGIGVARATKPGGPFEEFSGNPIVPLGGGGTFDDYHIRIPTIVYDEFETDESKRWKLWYQARDGAAGSWYVGYTYTDDPWSNNWSRGVDTGIASADAGNGPSVIKVGTVLYMALPDSSRNAIDIWTSVNGITWTNRCPNAIPKSVTNGDWDENQVAFAGIFWNLGTFYIWYYGYNDNTDWQIGMAYSLGDGCSYTKYYENPIISGIDNTEKRSGGQSGVYAPSLLMINDVFHVYYACNDSADDQNVCHATIP